MRHSIDLVLQRRIFPRINRRVVKQPGERGKERDARNARPHDLNKKARSEKPSRLRAARPHLNQTFRPRTRNYAHNKSAVRGQRDDAKQRASLIVNAAYKAEEWSVSRKNAIGECKTRRPSKRGATSRDDNGAMLRGPTIKQKAS